MHGFLNDPKLLWRQKKVTIEARLLKQPPQRCILKCISRVIDCTDYQKIASLEVIKKELRNSCTVN